MKRLETIIKFINQDDIVADIGCDHGYLLKLAIENKNIKKGYAIDNKKGPLDTAIKNLKISNAYFSVIKGKGTSGFIFDCNLNHRLGYLKENELYHIKLFK